MRYFIIEKINPILPRSVMNFIFLLVLAYQGFVNFVFAVNMPFLILVPIDFTLFFSIVVAFVYIIKNYNNDNLNFNYKDNPKKKYLYYFTLFGLELNLFVIIVFLIIGLHYDTFNFIHIDYQCYMDTVAFIFILNIINIMQYRITVKKPVREWIFKKFRSRFISQSPRLKPKNESA